MQSELNVEEVVNDRSLKVSSDFPLMSFHQKWSRFLTRHFLLFRFSEKGAESTTRPQRWSEAPLDPRSCFAWGSNLDWRWYCELLNPDCRPITIQTPLTSSPQHLYSIVIIVLHCHRCKTVILVLLWWDTLYKKSFLKRQWNVFKWNTSCVMSIIFQDCQGDPCVLRAVHPKLKAHHEKI